MRGRWLAYIANIVLCLFGLADLVWHDKIAHVVDLQPGMNLLLICVGLSMASLVLHKDLEEHYLRTQLKAVQTLAERCGVCTAVHESEFYALWPRQFEQAAANIDVAHLGPRRPNQQRSDTESKYFGSFIKMAKKSKAQIRRVERMTREKLEWIEELISGLTDATGFSLGIYEDDLGDAEMPRALSISRVDMTVAWIVAMTEQQSLQGLRDLEVRGREAVGLFATYFENRLWRPARIVIREGKFDEAVWSEIKSRYQS